MSEANDRYLKLMEKVKRADPTPVSGGRKYWRAVVSSGLLSRDTRITWHLLPCIGPCDGCN